MRYALSRMRHFFILGANPALSAAEIVAMLDGNKFTVTEISSQAMIVDAAAGATLDAAGLMRRLGGTIKIGTIVAEDLPLHPGVFTERMTEILENKTRSGRIAFGLSVYALDAGPAVAGKLKNVGMEVKRVLKENGIASRWVKPQTGAALTSVVVGKNKLIEDGAEFVALVKGDAAMLATTDVVQPFEEFSAVDYGRPERDLIQGMLPPKVARIMLNLAKKSGGAIMDPFCGSGTILTEALQLGFTEIYGSDKNPAAIESTKKNIAWVQKRGFAPTDVAAHLAVADSRNLNEKVPKNSIDAVVTEPFLGPPRTGRETRGALQRTLAELSRLYYESLSSWRPLLKSDAPIVMALPMYVIGAEKHGIQASDFEKLGFKTEPLLSASILSRLGARETKNHGLLYGREGQHVWREIVRLRLTLQS